MVQLLPLALLWTVGAAPAAPTVPLRQPISARTTIATHNRGQTWLLEPTSNTIYADAMMTAEGDLCVLRNREDVRKGRGTVMEQGRRVDRYDGMGHLRATATLPATARWILHADGRVVVVFGQDGQIYAANFGQPQPGGVIDR